MRSSLSNLNPKAFFNRNLFRYANAWSATNTCSLTVTYSCVCLDEVIYLKAEVNGKMSFYLKGMQI